MPQPLTLVPLCSCEPETCGTYLNGEAFAASTAAVSTPVYRCHSPSGPTGPEFMFFTRNVNGSTFAAIDSMSMNCSAANDVCGPDGARSGPFWNMPIAWVCVFTI